MRKILLTITILLLLTGCANRMTTWTWGENDAVGVRVGTTFGDMNEVEIGVSSLWYPSDEAPQIWGVYGLYYFDDILDVNQPIPFEFLPTKIKVKPYFGGLISVDFEGEDARTMAGPVAGLKIPLDKNERLSFGSEYGYRAISDYLDEYLQDEHKISFGLRIKF